MSKTGARKSFQYKKVCRKSLETEEKMSLWFLS